VLQPLLADSPPTPPADPDLFDPRSVEIIDDRPARIRRPLDVVRLVGLVLALAIVAGLATLATDTSSGATADLSRLVHEVPHVLVRILSLVGTFGALVAPIAFVVTEIIRGQGRRLIEALLTGLLAILVVRAVDVGIDSIPHSAIHAALTHSGQLASVRPLDAYLAALMALITVSGALRDRLWRVLFVIVIAVYIASAFAARQASMLSLLSSPMIGAIVGLAVRYAAGIADDRPGGVRIAGELARRGIELRRLERTSGPNDDPREYRAATIDGTDLTVQVFDRSLIASGAFYGVYRFIRLRGDITPTPTLTLERVAEQRSLLAMVTAAAGVPIPRLVAGVPCGGDTIVLAYQRINGAPLVHPSPDQLSELWRTVVRLHRNRITHRGLTAERILIDDTGRLVLPIPEDGSAFASDLRISLDRAQLLITTAQLVGADQAVRSAREVLGDTELAAVLTVLQPIALPRETRAALKRHPDLLEAVTDQIQGQTNHRGPELSRLERVRPRTVFTIAALIVAVYLLVGQLGSVDLVTVFSGAKWMWVPFVFASSALTYVGAALCLTGYVRERLSFTRTVIAQVAASFAGFVTPPSVGGLAVNLRYLRKGGVSTAGAATSVGLSQVVNGASHVLLLIAFAAATGATAHHSLPIPSWAFLVGGAVAIVVLAALTIPATRHWLLNKLVPPFREALPRLLYLISTPAKLAEGSFGTLLLNGSYIAALWFSVWSFGGHVAFAAVAVVYLAGAAIGAAAPTPGGLGAVEVALSTGLVAAGMSSAAAISAVLLFRIATFWLPVPFGWLAMQWLQRRDAL
jgi:uncharacterized protein (TIRG00374 family)